MIGQICKLLRRIRDRQEGSPVLEFAIGAPALLLLLSGLIEFGMIMFVTVLLESGLREAARFGITGNQPADGTEREAEIRRIIDNVTLGLIDMDDAEIDIRHYPTFDDVGKAEAYNDSDGSGSYTSGETYNDCNGNGHYDNDRGAPGPGGARDVVLYEVTYGWPLLTPMIANVVGDEHGKYKLDATLVVRNEPWDATKGEEDQKRCE